jgi:hypothetical protein
VNESQDIAEAEVPVHDVLARPEAEGRELACTAVMTVPAGLWEKEFLVRRRDGKAYVYGARDEAGIARDIGRLRARTSAASRRRQHGSVPRCSSWARKLGSPSVFASEDFRHS